MSHPSGLTARIWNSTPRRPVRQRDADDAMPAAVATLLRRLGVPVTLASVREQIAAHPDFPRLPCVIECLSGWGVAVQAARADWEHLAELRGPVLAHLDRGGEPQLVVLTGVRDGAIELIAPDRGVLRESRSAFCERWSGILLIPSARPGAGEKQYAAQRRRELFGALRAPLLGTAAGLAGALLLASLPVSPQGLGGLWAGLAGLKLLGFAVCIALVGLSSGRRPESLGRLCPVGKRLSCTAVLESPGARIAGRVPVADLGLLYFLGGLLCLGMGAATGSTAVALGLLAALNLAALPYTLFSIGYQAAIVRRWCWLCVLTQGLLYAELAVLWRQANPLAAAAAALGDPGRSGPLLLASFVLPALAWAWLKPVWALARSAEGLRRDATRLRNTPELFDAALRRQRQLGPEPETGVLLGDPSSPMRLTLISHPQCPACADVHEELETLLESAGGLLHCSIQLDWSARGSSPRIAARVAQLRVGAGHAAATEALADWYRDLRQDPEGWLRRFPAPADVDVAVALEEQRRWLDATPIAGTPALFLDGRALPPGFGLGALKQFLRHSARRSARRAAAA